MKKADTYYPRNRIKLRWWYVFLLLCTTGSVICCIYDPFTGQVLLCLVGCFLVLLLIADLCCNRTGVLISGNHIIVKRPFYSSKTIEKDIGYIAVVPSAVWTKYGVKKEHAITIKKDKNRLHFQREPLFRICLLEKTTKPFSLTLSALEHQIILKNHIRRQFVLDVPFSPDCLRHILSLRNAPVCIKQDDTATFLAALSMSNAFSKLSVQTKASSDVCYIRFLREQ